jgi:hypothetical protein
MRTVLSQSSRLYAMRYDVMDAVRYNSLHSHVLLPTSMLTYCYLPVC